MAAEVRAESMPARVPWLVAAAVLASGLARPTFADDSITRAFTVSVANPTQTDAVSRTFTVSLDDPSEFTREAVSRIFTVSAPATPQDAVSRSFTVEIGAAGSDVPAVRPFGIVALSMAMLAVAITLVIRRRRAAVT